MSSNVEHNLPEIDAILYEICQYVVLCVGNAFEHWKNQTNRLTQRAMAITSKTSWQEVQRDFHDLRDPFRIVTKVTVYVTYLNCEFFE